MENSGEESNTEVEGVRSVLSELGQRSTSIDKVIGEFSSDQIFPDSKYFIFNFFEQLQ